MPGWNIADVFEVVAAAVPASPALIYGPEELSYLWQDCDARAVVFAGSFAATIERTRASVPGVLAWLWVDDGAGPCPPWAVPYESAAAPATPRPEPAWGRDGDDIILLYTGGTTGLPKGVIWRQDDLMVSLGNAAGGRYPDEPDLAFARSRIADPGRWHLPAAPLMHGAGCLTCLPVLARGGAGVLLADPAFRAGDLLDTIDRHRVNSVGWVGDAFARPVLGALDADPGRWDLSSWSVLTSGGCSSPTT
jgi:3-oxocholest-4-en-26-oate---CoA ligase